MVMMMTKQQQLATAELAVRLARTFPALSPYSAVDLAARLRRIGRAAELHALRCCNDADYDDATGRSRLDRQGSRWMARLADLAFMTAPGASATDAGVSIEIEGDPRGICLRLKLPGMVEAVSV